MPRKLLRLLVSAYQSRLFNTLLAERLPTLARMEPGDLAYLHDRGAVFSVDDVDEEVETIRTEAEEAVQRQMDAMANRFIEERDAGGGDGPPDDGSPGPGTVPPRTPDDEGDEDEDEDDEAAA